MLETWSFCRKGCHQCSVQRDLLIVNFTVSSWTWMILDFTIGFPVEAN